MRLHEGNIHCTNLRTKYFGGPRGRGKNINFKVEPTQREGEGGKIWEIPNILKKLAEEECKKSYKPNMVELQWWEHVETMYLPKKRHKRKNSTTIFEGGKWPKQICLQKSLKDAIKKLCSRFGWPMMIANCWNHVPTLAA